MLLLLCLALVALTGLADVAGASTSVWRPKPGTTWQWQLAGKVNTTVKPAKMFDIDLQDAAVPGVSARQL